MRGRGEPPAVAALDVGTSKVLAAIALVEPEGLRVLGLGRAACDGVRRGAVVDLPAVTAAVAAAAARARRVAGRRPPSAVLGSAGGEVVATTREAEIHLDPPGEVTPEHVEALLGEVRRGELPAGFEVVHALPREYTVDGVEGCRHPVGMAAGSVRLSAHVVACRSTLLRNLCKAVDDAGLEVAGFAVSALAAAEAVLTEEERRQGVLLLDCGAGATQLCAVVGGEPAATAVVPLGGAHITADIAVGLGISWEAAEEVKQRHASADPAAASDRPLDWLAGLRPAGQVAAAAGGGGAGRGQATEHDLYEIVQARVEEVLERVAALVDHAGLEGRLPAGAVLTGGASRLRGLAAAAMRVLGMPVRLGGALGVTGPLAAPDCAALVGLLQLAAQRHTGGRRVGPLHAGAGRRLAAWLSGRLA
jgi:cell division protein FtsA